MLRQPIIRAELDSILKDLISLTYDYSTALNAHKVLEQIVEIQCMIARSTEISPNIDNSMLRVANTIQN